MERAPSRGETHAAVGVMLQRVADSFKGLTVVQPQLLKEQTGAVGTGLDCSTHKSNIKSGLKSNTPIANVKLVIYSIWLHN